MFIQKRLEKEINTELFKQNIKIPGCPLPFKDVYIDDVEGLINELEDGYIKDLAKDLEKTMMWVDTITGDIRTFHTVLGKDLWLKYAVRQSRVSRVVETLRGPVTKVIDVLKEIDPSACAVGGCVRDAILGKEPKDWDFVSGLDYDTLELHFIQKGFKVTETGKQFLVLNVSIDGENFEIALYRKDGMYEDGRRPESVEVGTIEDDSQRRDFTVNAMYFQLSNGRLTDPTGMGLQDIIDMKLRFVGNPKDRLEEDMLRGWRYIRFLVTKGFLPDKKSYRAVKEHWETIYNNSNPQRVLDEMFKMYKI